MAEYRSSSRNTNYSKKKSRNFENEFEADWIAFSIKKEAIDYAEAFGEFLVKGVHHTQSLTSSQIRNIFGEVKRIQMKGFTEEKTSFLLLKPKVEYAAKRANKEAVLKFKDIFKLAHDAVDADSDGAEKRFKNFCDFIEAILAYHKAFDGK